MNKKYKLTDETIEVYGRVLHRIEALCNFGDVTKGSLGGFIESEANLSQDGNAWVLGDAKVFDRAKVYGDAWVFDGAEAYGDAWVFGNAKVFGKAKVFDGAEV